MFNAPLSFFCLQATGYFSKAKGKLPAPRVHGWVGFGLLRLCWQFLVRVQSLSWISSWLNCLFSQITQKGRKGDHSQQYISLPVTELLPFFAEIPCLARPGLSLATQAHHLYLPQTARRNLLRSRRVSLPEGRYVAVLYRYTFREKQAQPGQLSAADKSTSRGARSPRAGQPPAAPPVEEGRWRLAAARSSPQQPDTFRQHPERARPPPGEGGRAAGRRMRLRGAGSGRRCCGRRWWRGPRSAPLC